MGWVVSVTPRPRSTPGKGPPGTQWIGGWVGLRADLDTEARRKIIYLCRGPNPVVQSVVRHYSDWATPAPIISTQSKIILWFGVWNEVRNFKNLNTKLPPPHQNRNESYIYIYIYKTHGLPQTATTYIYIQALSRLLLNTEEAHAPSQGHWGIL
jgi:hypothetical protein